MGFLTQKELGEFAMPDHVAVYLPQSYNFAGQTIIVPAESRHARSTRSRRMSSRSSSPAAFPTEPETEADAPAHRFTARSPLAVTATA